MKKKLYIVVFMLPDGHACSQPVVAISPEEAEKIAIENEAVENLEIDECYAITDETLAELDDKCEGCGEELLVGQAVIKGENRHASCS